MRKALVLVVLSALSSGALANPTLIKGTPVCNTLKSAKAAGILAAGGNSLLPLPKDCVRAGRSAPIARLDWHHSGKAAMLAIETPGQMLFVWAPRMSVGYPAAIASRAVKLKLASIY